MVLILIEANLVMEENKVVSPNTSIETAYANVNLGCCYSAMRVLI